ncbi:pilus assembly protein, partial [Vibrio sp. FNV 38]|nr:pilus assembly protein [Vibrio sp. FNV 38]
MRQKFISLKKQSGVAAIWLGLSLVPIMGFTFWAVEGTRYVQESSRLRDATEAAALAVTIQDIESTSVEMSQRYIKSYVRDIKVADIHTTRLFQEEDEDNDKLEFIQYTVDSLTTHTSWFSSNFIPSFSETQDLAGRSLARKYPAYLGDKSIDLVFVSDFSGSMKGDRIKRLKVAVKEIAKELLLEIEQDDEAEFGNRLALVPYNLRTQYSTSGSSCYSGNSACYSDSQLRYKNNYKNNVSNYKYEDINWSQWSGLSSTYLSWCSQGYSSYCPNGINNNVGVEQGKRVKHVIDMHRSYSLLDIPEYIAYNTTLDDMMEDKRNNYQFTFNLRNNNLFSTIARGDFETIPLTESYEEIATVDKMSPNGGTAVYQGLLRGIQILNEVQPTEDASEEELEAYESVIPMIIILSDGKEDPYPEIFQTLVDDKLCDIARSSIPNLYIGVIGIDFSASGQTGFQDCVINQDEDIIDVSNLDDLIDKIKELIRKGSLS